MSVKYYQLFSVKGHFLGWMRVCEEYLEAGEGKWLLKALDDDKGKRRVINMPPRGVHGMPRQKLKEKDYYGKADISPEYAKPV